jgi:heat shock protein HslJ
MMLCFPNDVMAQEQEYLNLLGDAESFRIQDDKLIIEVAGDKALVFVEQ